MTGLTILKKVRCLGRLSGSGADPAVALHLRNAADYRLPTFGPHGTKVGHSWYQWIIESDFSGWFDNSEIGDVSEQIEWMGGGWSRGCTPPKECCRLPPTYLWATWHQTRAFLISVNNKKWFFWLVWQFWNRTCVWADWVDGGGWSRGCTPPKECCRLPPTYFWTTWHQTRAFLISLNNKSDFSGWFDNFEKGEVSGHIEWMGVWSRGCTPPMNAADYRLPTFGPHGTILGHSWYQ